MAIVVTFRVPESLLSAAIEGYGTPSLGDPALKGEVLRLIRTALNEDCSPLELSPDEESAPARRINLSLADALARPISILAKKHGASEGVICRRLLFSLQRKGAAFVSATTQLPTPAPIAEFLAAWNAAHPHSPMQPRHPQSRFFNYLVDALSGSNIGLCEAATGTGKTLAMLLAARDRLQRNPESRVLIAVPTVAVMRQFVETYRDMAGTGMNMPAIRTILGRRAFVSPAKIQEIIDDDLGNLDPQVVETVEKWVASGGAPVGAIEFPWLAHSLKIIAPDFPADAACLPDTPDINDPGLIAYQTQFKVCEEEPTAEIILSTHAMLAIDARNRLLASAKDEDVKQAHIALGAMRKQAAKTEDEKERKGLWKAFFEESDALTALRAEITADIGKLPAWHYLMVDEAHQMEQNFSNALSSYISLNAFVSACKRHAGHGLSHSRLQTILANMEIIRTAGMKEENIWLHTPGAAQHSVSAALREIADAASGIGKRRAKKANADLDPESLRGLEQAALRISRDAAVIRQAADTSPGATAFVSFSPVRFYPQIHVGSKSVASQLSFTWATARAGVAVSATLYLPKGDGHSAWYQRTLLSIHDSRAKEYPPVAPPWVFTQVDAIYLPPPEPIIPAGESAPRLVLRPPTRSDRLDPLAQSSAETLWLGDLEKTLRGIYATAKGGVLVLMTSYDSARRLGDMLSAGLEESLIIASADTGVEKQKRRYLDISKNAGRPIWLAVGAAWTGLDLSGKLIGLQPHQDEVLTDLVIPRVPFGSNRSLTHAHRIKNDPTVSWEIIDAAFMQKQGMGRLIRSEGLPSKRRIWILDNRMNDSRNKLNLAFKLVKSLMAGYHQRTLDF